MQFGHQIVRHLFIPLCVLKFSQDGTLDFPQTHWKIHFVCHDFQINDCLKLIVTNI